LALAYSGTALPVANGGTGLTNTPANGQILIGNGTKYSIGTLTAGSGISITNSSGAITITNTGGGGGGGGTVTSVGLSAPALFTVTNSPVTGSGTLTLAYTNGQALPVASGGTGLTAAPTNGQIDIGSTNNGFVRTTLTAGSGITITNSPGAITITNTGGGGGGGLSAITTASASISTPTLGQVYSGVITGFKAYGLLQMSASAGSWIRAYTSTAARIADASRAQGTSPSAGAGVIAEIITTGAQTLLISPGALGFSSESPPTVNIPIAVVNNTLNVTSITVTFTLIQLAI
jgi:hypothetical protein